VRRNLLWAAAAIAMAAAIAAGVQVCTLLPYLTARVTP
jgi:hypothetical protein